MKSVMIFVLFALFAMSMAAPLGLLGFGGLGLGGLSWTQRIQGYPHGIFPGVGLGHPALLFG